MIYNGTDQKIKIIFYFFTFNPEKFMSKIDQKVLRRQHLTYIFEILK